MCMYVYIYIQNMSTHLECFREERLLTNYSRTTQEPPVRPVRTLTIDAEHIYNEARRRDVYHCNRQRFVSGSGMLGHAVAAEPR